MNDLEFNFKVTFKAMIKYSRQIESNKERLECAYRQNEGGKKLLKCIERNQVNVRGYNLQQRGTEDEQISKKEELVDRV